MGMLNNFKTNTCGNLRINDINKIIKLSGWVHNKRDHGGVLFIDLRDRYGITQIVINDNLNIAEISKIHYESVITIVGKVVPRSKETINSSIATGEIEIYVTDYNATSYSEVLPFQINKDDDVNEELRLRYRFLDLRREKLKNTILLRSEIMRFVREKMHEIGFTEFQTPILTASSPEGARDFLVPSRLHPGKFYALPQAPQQFKQLLMISGFDKYFQIAPCFRDEDPRADRSPTDFYQLDMEMSFVEQEDILSTMEPVVKSIFEKFKKDKKVSKENFKRIKYNDSFLLYGTDKPDLRNPIINSDVTEIFRDSGFSIFADNINKGSVVRAIPAFGTSENSRSFFDDMIKFAQNKGAKGLAYIIFDKDGLAKGPIAKLLDVERLNKIKEITKIKNGDSIFFSCDKEAEVNKMAGYVRTELGNRLNLIDKSKFEFCWIIDFPYFEWDCNNKKIDFSHNPFSLPKCNLDFLEKATKEELLSLDANQYDLVCNGYELASGAVRNTNLDLLYKAFNICGYTKEEVTNKFGGLTNAFKFGVPQHAGMAIGLERVIMLLADTTNIRDVIIFPMNGSGEDLLMNAPSEVSEKQLKDLCII